MPQTTSKRCSRSSRRAAKVPFTAANGASRVSLDSRRDRGRIGSRSRAKPASGTTRVSMPLVVPAKRTVASGSCRTMVRASASPGNTCPPDPPAATSSDRPGRSSGAGSPPAPGPGRRLPGAGSGLARPEPGPGAVGCGSAGVIGVPSWACGSGGWPGSGGRARRRPWPSGPGSGGGRRPGWWYGGRAAPGRAGRGPAGGAAAPALGRGPGGGRDHRGPHRPDLVPGHVQQHAGGGQQHQHARPAEGDQRQRHPGDRQHAHHRADVDQRLDDDPDGDPGGQVAAERVGGALGDPDAGVGEGDEQQQDREGAEQAELLADDGEDEVGVGVGHIGPLLPPGPQPDPEQPPGAEGEAALDELVAAVLGVGGGVHERQEPGPAVVGAHDQAHAGGQAERPDPAQQQQRGPGHEQHAEGDGAQQQGGAEVGLQHHQGGQQHGQGQHRHQQVADVAEQPGLAGEHVGREQQQGQLGELGRLDGDDAADRDPAGRPVGRHRARVDEHVHQPGGGHHQQGRAQPAPQAVVDAADHQHDHGPAGHPQQLALEVGVGVALPGQGEHRGGGQHHDQPDDQQRAGHGEQQPVGGAGAQQRPGRPPGPPGVTGRHGHHPCDPAGA